MYMYIGGPRLLRQGRVKAASRPRQGRAKPRQGRAKARHGKNGLPTPKKSAKVGYILAILGLQTNYIDFVSILNGFS